MDKVREPDRRLADPAHLLLGYLDYYRSVVARKLDELPHAELRATRLPSGWTPLELLKHLVYMERRWLRWGFLAEPVEAPLGDEDDAGRWHVGPHENAADLIAAMHTGGARTREIVTGAALSDVAPLGGRFQPGDKHPQPTLAWILFHVLQEYARHAGHLDVVRELADGRTGE
jgi:uncharacterized damage-inducible protein DinB